MKCKKIVDARSYSHDALEKIRKDTVLRIEAGESPEEVAKGLGVNRRTVYRWLEAYHYGGLDALNAKPIPGAPPKVNAKQMKELNDILRNINPLQLNFDFALWTLAMIRELIGQRFGIKLSEVSVGRLMKRLGFTPQRPLYRAWQQDPVLVDNWQECEYPKIVAKAKRENAVIFFADEAGMRSDHHAGTTWAPKGNTPIVKATGARFSMNMLSAVSPIGHFRFMVVDGSVTATVFRDFLKRLITGMDRKVFLIVDGHPTHKAKIVKQFVADNEDKIELFFLPSYSPELNPDEQVWSNVKQRVAKSTISTKDQMKSLIVGALRRLQKLPDIVVGFFDHPHCRYARA